MAVSLLIQHSDHSSLVHLANRLPLIQDITVATDEPLDEVELVAEFSPEYVAPIHWNLGMLSEGRKIVKGKCGVYDPALVAALTENSPGKCRVSLVVAGEERAVEAFNFTWLPRHSWVGCTTDPELLAALVLPNDPAVDRVLSLGADILRKNGLTPGWRGYTAERNAIINQVHALWDALGALGVTCTLPPRSWNDFGVGQKIRTPSQVLQGGCATCLDSTLFLAAAIAQASFSPLVILLPGHAFVGVMLKDDVLPSPVEKHASTVRNLLELDEVLVMETTLATRRGEAERKQSFEEAVKSAKRQLRVMADDPGFLALDIVRIWSTGVRPIAGEPTSETSQLPQREPQSQPESSSSFLPETSAEQEEKSMFLATPNRHDRMANWQLKLLDLSLRNKLLNSRIDRSQVKLLLPSVAKLEEALASGERFTICNLPETIGTRITQERARQPELLRTELMPLAEAMFAKKQLLAIDKPGQMTDKRLETRVRNLYLTAKHDMEESGCSTLNLACGFLKWFRKGDEAKPLYAPLLLLPVTLSRPSVRAGFTLHIGDEEATINLTLLELLKTEYAMRIPALEGELPLNGSGVDVPAILQSMRQAVREHPGWEVMDECTLGVFSFAKHLMWQDLVQKEQIFMERSLIVRHLAAAEPEIFPAQVDFPDPRSLDDATDAHHVFTPLSADSSQLAAVLAAGRGKNFVLIGPPGTGKSQTIANMIAHCLGQGKTVLFVAEKAAALSVVYKRLRHIGLGDFCLELHSNKANKKEVIAQYRTVLERIERTVLGRVERAVRSPRWDEKVDRMVTLRQKLNQLPAKLHHVYPDGMSLFEDIGHLAVHPATTEFQACPEAGPELTAEQHEAMRQQARSLVLRFSPVADVLPQPSVAATTYSTVWEDRTVGILRSCLERIRLWEAASRTLLSSLQLDVHETLPHLNELVQLLTVAAKTRGMNVTSLLPESAEESLDLLRSEMEHVDKYRQAQASLSLPYPDEALDENQLGVWWNEWRRAEACNFLSRFLTHWRINKALRMLAFSRITPKAANDLPLLIAMRKERDALEESLRRHPDCLLQYRKGVESKAEWLEEAEQIANALQDVRHFTTQAKIWLSSRTNNPVAPGKQVAASLDSLQEATKRLELEKTRATLAESLGSWPPEATDGMDALKNWAEKVLDLRLHWRDLTLWNEQAAAARAKGFSPMVDALLSHEVKPDELESEAEANLCRQRARRAIEGDKNLNRFTTSSQEKKIRDFTKADASLLDFSGKQLVADLSTRAKEVWYDKAYSKELAFLQREIAKQRAHKPPRMLLANTPQVTRLLKPCLLMSPLSVAQYLGPDAVPFDVVVFDEASQIPVWDAIGAIGRGCSAVIVGDPRQMPPTSFFSRAKNDDETAEDEVQDMESILDECRACGIPEMNLTWHYRSKAESLIAFSNHNYYEGKLVTFPAPLTTDAALQYHYVKGTYQRGSKRTNPVEAKALVEHVVQTLKAPGFRYTETTSIGIVTFNTQQQKLIEDLLEDARAEDDSLEPYFSEDNPEAVFVKNLENVQGDERGCIYFSTTFGPDEKGVVSMNFGPLNNTGGERRLNVAITRARASMHVFSSMRPEDIDLGRTKARGVVDLRNFLDCASRGVSAYFQSARAADGAKSEQELVTAVVNELTKLGWKCRANIGVSEFRIDIAVEHPEIEGAMLAAIRTDGPAYRDACTARDRDILRESVLGGLGWRLIHVWSLDWWRYPSKTLASIDEQLRKFVELGPPSLKELPSITPPEQRTWEAATRPRA